MTRKFRRSSADVLISESRPSAQIRPSPATPARTTSGATATGPPLAASHAPAQSLSADPVAGSSEPRPRCVTCSTEPKRTDSGRSSWTFRAGPSPLRRSHHGPPVVLRGPHLGPDANRCSGGVVTSRLRRQLRKDWAASSGGASGSVPSGPMPRRSAVARVSCRPVPADRVEQRRLADRRRLTVSFTVCPSGHRPVTGGQTCLRQP